MCAHSAHKYAVRSENPLVQKTMSFGQEKADIQRMSAFCLRIFAYRPAATMQLSTSVSTTNTAPTHFVALASLASTLLALLLDR